MKRTLLPILASVVALSGCTLAPKYRRPDAPMPVAWPAGVAGETAASTQAKAAPDIPWQEFFSDSKLQQVIGLALTNNRDLRIAALTVERARALYNIQRGELLPSVNAVGSGVVTTITVSAARPNESTLREMPAPQSSRITS